jgi:hypothetical protein
MELSYFIYQVPARQWQCRNSATSMVQKLCPLQLPYQAKMLKISFVVKPLYRANLEELGRHYSIILTVDAGDYI